MKKQANNTKPSKHKEDKNKKREQAKIKAIQQGALKIKEKLRRVSVHTPKNMIA